MTSHIIDGHKTRTIAPKWSRSRKPNTDAVFCAFCDIINHDAVAYKVFENDSVIAILDILPIRSGHVLVIPKPHYQRVSELPPDIARAVGEAVSKVANALTKAMENTALNVVCNQEYAQAVPHVHYHIVPAPTTASSEAVQPLVLPLSQMELHRREFDTRTELDDDEANVLIQKIKSKL